MQLTNQDQIAFFLTGRRSGTDMQPIDASYRPAHFASVSDLTSLRYDVPLVLNFDDRPDRAVLSLSRLIDEAIESLADDPDRLMLARHGYAIERELRRELAETVSGDISKMWHAAAERLSKNTDEKISDSAARLWNLFEVTGTVIDADSEFSSRAVYHAWNSVQENKAAAFRQRVQRILLKLHDILDAEAVGSKVGRSPERLRSAVGVSFAGAFDFDQMSRILIDAKPGISLSEKRRSRIDHLIRVLESQRFYSIGPESAEPYSFSFFRCSDALEAYRDRHSEAVELLKALAVADLESKGEYRDAVHDQLFEGFGQNGLSSAELAVLPDYFVCTDASSLDAAETAQLIEILAAGLPIKVLARTDDILEPSIVAEGHAALGLRSRQLVNTAIALTDVFVFQASASHSFQMIEQLLRGLTYDGPALFSVFSGATGHNHNLAPYLVAAAAMESRAFPAFVYDPSAGSDWASRLSVDENPSVEDDWPAHELLYEDGSLQARSESTPFTLADFMAMDERFVDHFALMSPDGQGDESVPIAQALELDMSAATSNVPYVFMIDENNVLRKAVVDNRLLAETRRCQAMWHSLQELGGIHNSHAERLLANELRSRSVEIAANPQSAEIKESVTAPIQEPVAAVVATIVEPTAKDHGDDPYIETARCTTCNECTNVNPRMFAYNAEKQAYIADPDAGTYRQLVEAAEGCQVSIIHPGKPRNPKEPGLEDLIERAKAFA